MIESEFLHELIRNMDRDEFKFVQDFVQFGRSKPTQRGQLLTDLRKQEEYNPQKLKPKYKGFEVVKSQLKTEVMRALRVYHEEDGVDHKIASLLHNERILYKKGIYGQAKKELNEAVELAAEHQKLGRVLEILQIRQFRLVERETRNLPLCVSENFDMMDLVLDAYGKQIASFRSYQELFAKYRVAGQVVEDEEQETPVELWQPDPQRMDFYRRLYENAHDTIEAQVSGDTLRATDLAGEAVELFDSVPKIREELILIYKIQLSNYGVLLAASGQFDRAQKVLSQLRSYQPKDFNDEAETFQNIVHIELLLLVNQRKFDAYKGLMDRVEAGLKHYGEKVNAARKLSIWYNMMVYYFVNENWKRAKELIELILSHRKYAIRQEIQYTTRVLQLIVFFELDGGDWLENPILAAKRYLERNSQLGPFKRSVLESLMELIYVDKPVQIGIFSKLEQSLKVLAQEPPHPDNLGLELVAGWALSRAQGMSIKDCLS